MAIDMNFKKAAKRYRYAMDKHGRWRDDARTCFDFVDGDQWPEEDLAYLREQLRPAVTFNRVGVYVDGVCGLEKLNRMELNYVPRRLQGGGSADLMNAIARYFYDDCNGSSEESEAFHDMVTCGMGWTNTRVAYDTNPEGDFMIERIDPLDMIWDPTARGRNLRDAKWVMRIKTGVSREELEGMFGAIDWEDVDEKAPWDGEQEDIVPHDATRAPFYEETSERGGTDDTFTLCEYQWIAYETIYRVTLNNETFSVPEKDFKELKEKYKTVEGAKVPKRVYHRAFFIGSTEIEAETLPVQDGFTYQCMTAKRRRQDNSWYGLVSFLRDPQLWVNKFFSSIQYQIATQAKGGLLAERGAFENDSQAEMDWARPDSITFLTRGALSGGHPKVQEKPVGQYPTGIDRLMKIAMDMFRDVSGMSLELLGLAEKNQPGVLEMQRKQAGMTILAWAFDALSDYRKKQGRLVIGFAREFLSDGRMIRIATDEGQHQYIPVIKDSLMGEYDVIVTESPKSVNERERVFSMLAQLLPTLVELGIPLPPALLDYIPLPETLATQWKEHIASMSEQPQEQDPVAAAQAQELNTRAELNQARAQQAATKTQTDMMEVSSRSELNKAKAFREETKAILGD